MAGRRSIAVVTGSRAEFGLLAPVMRAIQHDDRLQLLTLVTGAHLTSGTWREVQRQFAVDRRVPMQRKDASGRASDVTAVGRGIAGFGGVFEELKPDIVLLLGDRIEAFAAASAASIGGWRLAHLHGGDRAEGVADESMRHAISKLAHLHFPATAQSRRRLIRMGEDPDLIFNVGSPAVDGLRAVQPSASAPDVIVMQHPIGDAPHVEKQRMGQTLAAVRRWQRDNECSVLVMSPNGDSGWEGIEEACRTSPVRAEFAEHLPREQWLRRLAGAQVIVGNSSAGLIEAAVLKVPCVNIGSRQAGREKPRNVIDCDYGEQTVYEALTEAAGLDLCRMRHPYGDGRTGPRVANLLATLPLGRLSVRKRNRY